MFNQRWRFVVWAVAGLIGIWLVAWAGHAFLESRRMTADKVRDYVKAVDISKLSGQARADALRALEDKVNALSLEERRQLRVGRLDGDWAKELTEAEKEQFIEATMPTHFKQMISAFEQLPDDKRRQTIDDAMRRLHEAASRGGVGAPSDVSPELVAEVRNIGLNAFYSQSSAQTKAELAPLLEEIQRQMESRRMLRR